MHIATYVATLRTPMTRRVSFEPSSRCGEERLARLQADQSPQRLPTPTELEAYTTFKKDKAA